MDNGSMAQSCIICGGATGSREHIFPAALGGRRTNKGIYCGTHNEGYSPLAAILSTQLKGINVLLGVVGDHSSEPHTMVAADSASGRLVKMSAGRSEFSQPELVSESGAADGVVRRMMFSSEQQLQEWIADERAKGHQVKRGQREPSQSFFLSDSHLSFSLGGTDGLRAIGYVALSFLAHHFADLARAPELNAFKEFTLGTRHEPCVWWDFEPATDLLQSSFEFGHRAIVGVDPVTALAYGRVSLFSTLHFAVVFGSVPVTTAQAVIVDIDPLAPHPPNDIVERREASAFATVIRPSALTDSLSETIISGRAQQSFETLLSRIAARDLAIAADRMMNGLKDADTLGTVDREQLFEAVLSTQSQRILNLMRHIVDKAKASDQLRQLTPLLDPLVAADPAAKNGLSDVATATLTLARNALLAQMLDDYAGNRLDKARLQQLIGGAAGVLIVGQAIMVPVVDLFPDAHE